MRLPTIPARTRPDPRVACARCGVAYRPRLTHGACPVCGEEPVGIDPALLPRPLDDDTRITAILVATMAANLGILAVLAVLFLRA